MTTDERKVSAIHAILHLQCYTHYHDHAEATGLLTNRLKQQSKHLIEAFEADLKQNLIRSYNVEGGKAYEDCMVIVERMVEKITSYRLDQWPSLIEAIEQVPVLETQEP